MKTFNNSDAYVFGQTIVQIIEENELPPVRIRVVYDGDIVFQYMMDGKKSEEWLDRKQKTVLESGKSSLYVYEHQDEYPNMSMETGYAICGGGYPLIVNDELKGCFIVSGLAHEDDHGLIVEALERMELL